MLLVTLLQRIIKAHKLHSKMEMSSTDSMYVSASTAMYVCVLLIIYLHVFTHSKHVNIPIYTNGCNISLSLSIRKDIRKILEISTQTKLDG